VCDEGYMARVDLGRLHAHPFCVEPLELGSR